MHVGAFYLMGDLRVGAGGVPTRDITAVEDTRFEERIALDPKMLERTLAAVNTPTPTQDVPNETTQELPPLEELAPHLKESISFSPEITQAQNIQLATRKAGEIGSVADSVSALDLASAEEVAPTNNSATAKDLLKSMNQSSDPDRMKIKIQENAPDMGSTLNDLAAARKKGDNGLAGMGFSSLDDLIDMKTPITGDLKAMMPSDLLFDYNSAEVREAAKLDLQRLGFLIETWTKSRVIVEGHTDTIGTPEYNVDLSLRRAQAIKDFVVNSLRIDGNRIEVHGLGEQFPVRNAEGSAEEQAINRRVVIRFITP
jgi:outer membrane protein OmpA-like peptidoglycan-associated protein